MKRVLLFLLFGVMMASCRHFIDEENKGIIVKIEKNRFDDYQYRV